MIVQTQVSETCMFMVAFCVKEPNITPTTGSFKLCLSSNHPEDSDVAGFVSEIFFLNVKVLERTNSWSCSSDQKAREGCGCYFWGLFGGSWEIFQEKFSRAAKCFNSRISGTGKGKSAANLGSTLPLELVPTFCAGRFRNRQLQPSRVFLIWISHIATFLSVLLLIPQGHQPIQDHQQRRGMRNYKSTAKADETNTSKTVGRIADERQRALANDLILQPHQHEHKARQDELRHLSQEQQRKSKDATQLSRNTWRARITTRPRAMD